MLTPIANVLPKEPPTDSASMTLPDRPSPQGPYDRFLARVRKHHTVYGLRSADGEWAVCGSAESESVDVILIWSDRTEAAVHRKEDWRDYEVVPISAEEFVEVWLQGMHEDGSLVGLDWNADLSGLEVTAVDVAERLSSD